MDILSKSGSWYKVRYGKYTGYVMTQYVTVEGEIEEKEEKSSASSSAGMEGIESIADIGDAPATSRFGDSGSDVKKLQQALKLLNYYTGAIDGKYGSGTEEAVKKFQKSKGMSQDGIAGKVTIKLLFGEDAADADEEKIYHRGAGLVQKRQQHHPQGRQVRNHGLQKPARNSPSSAGAAPTISTPSPLPPRTAPP